MTWPEALSYVDRIRALLLIPGVLLALKVLSVQRADYRKVKRYAPKDVFIYRRNYLNGLLGTYVMMVFEVVGLMALQWGTKFPNWAAATAKLLSLSAGLAASYVFWGRHKQQKYRKATSAKDVT